MARRATTKKGRKGKAAGKAREQAVEAPGRRREVLGVVLLSLGVTLVLALWSFTPRDQTLLEQGYPATHNLIGPVGHHLASGLLSVIGLGAFVIALALLAGALACFIRQRVHLTVIEGTGYFLLMIFGATLAHLALGDLRPLAHAPGGAVGAVAGELLRTWLNTTGAVIAASAVFVLALMVASDFTVARIFGTAGRGLMAMLASTGPFLRDSFERASLARAERAKLREERRLKRALEREEKRTRKEALRAEKEARRRERLAVLREEGEVEASDEGLILVSSRTGEEEQPAFEEAEEASPKAQTDAPADAAGSRSKKKGAPKGRSATSRIDKEQPKGSVSSRSPGTPEDDRGSIPASPAARIAPSEELEGPHAAPPDPLADPNWADPDWVGGLMDLGCRLGEDEALESLELPAAPCELEAESRPKSSSRTREPAIVSRSDEKALENGAGAAALTGGPSRDGSLDEQGETAEVELGGGRLKDNGESCGAIVEAEPREQEAKEHRPRNETKKQPSEAKPPTAEEKEPEPRIIAPKAPARPSAPTNASQDTFAYTSHGEKFVLPSLDFLEPPPENTDTELDKEALVETARRLTEKLDDFGIAGEVVKIRPGPVITMYEFRPGPGVKISKIQGLADDLAMAMEALRVRIVAPIPGKNAVGIEVPNAKRQMVCMREILEQDGFQKSKSKLTLGMGKNIEGDPVIVDLAKMPHLLIAGTTGSGKSVSVNGMITSMLAKATPDEVRFIMIDPKVLELKLYEGIPHLLLPVVTDPAKAALALRWATEEMDRRYHLLADLNVRDLHAFNRKVTRLRDEWEARQSEMPPLPPIESVDGDPEAHEDLRRRHEERWLSDPPPPEKLPMLVIVIDELADLMMVASREVETYIARLAQKARAAGIHLLVATQRPSTDVLTGVIKINFPARISFRVASRHDSQTIINEPGAEKLLGNGDMLIIPPGQSEPVRAHGAFLGEEEIERVVEHLKTQGEPVYDESILQPRDEGGADGEQDEEESLDPKWDEALAILSERDTISVSWIQRRLAIGYNRAARMIEKMEREGIVGPADGSKPREVLLGAPPP